VNYAQRSTVVDSGVIKIVKTYRLRWVLN